MTRSPRVLMLVWTSVATDTRVLREARALVSAGRTVHIIGRAVPPGFDPGPGLTVASVGLPPRSQGRARTLSRLERLARWILLPVHVRRRLLLWQREAEALALEWAAGQGSPDVVHAHDYTALPVGARLSEAWGVPLVYDSHEYWVGRPVEGRPAPLSRRRERVDEDRLGSRCDAVITVGEGVARALREDHPGWPDVAVVRNTFPLRDGLPDPLPEPQELIYAGRLASYRELEVVAEASRAVQLPVSMIGPADEAWLATFDAGAATVLPSEPLAAIDARLAAAGAALVTHSDRWVNHRLALPNKLFHAVSLGVPVVATDVGELGAIVRHYGLGTLYRPGDAESLAAAVDGLVAGYPEYVAAVRKARPDLSWERDAVALVALHERLRVP